MVASVAFSSNGSAKNNEVFRKGSVEDEESAHGTAGVGEMKVVVVDGVYIRAIFLGKLGTERVEKDSVVGARIFIQRLMDKGLDLGWIKDIKVGEDILSARVQHRVNNGDCDRQVDKNPEDFFEIDVNGDHVEERFKKKADCAVVVMMRKRLGGTDGDNKIKIGGYW